MRKTLILLLIVLLVFFSAAGCGRKKKKKSSGNQYLQLATENLSGTFYNNNDDDDNNNTLDNADTSINGTSDEADLSEFKIVAHPKIASNWTGELSLDADSSGKVRLFYNTGANWSVVPFTGGIYTLSTAQLQTGVRFKIEALTYQEVKTVTSGKWCGKVEIQFVLKDGAGNVKRTEKLQMRVSPYIMTPNTQPAQMVYFVATSDNSTFRNELKAVLNSLGIPFIEVNGGSYSDDRWLQDSHEIGYSSVERSGTQVTMPVVLRAPRNRPLINYPFNELLNPDFGYTVYGTTSLDTPNEDASMNSFGNLEVTPPISGYPLGRIYYGGKEGFRRMDANLRAFLGAQITQADCLEVDSSWLAVGHVDEFMMFIPYKNSFKIAYASPRLAKNILQSLKDAGKGSTIIHQGKTGYQTTVDSVLNDSTFMAYNDSCQAKLDSIKTFLKSQLKLSDGHFVELPVLFEDYGGGYAVAWTAGAVNMLVLNSQNVVVPKQFGPQDGGVDKFHEFINSKLQPLGLTVHYVDCWDSYHVYMGEIHCGTNVKRQPLSTLWWKVR
ncbi:MAG: protein-arginine deiminase domain-containing protein [Planctomycetota bacterium]|nr:protein-arginine deiminase domain-containing protein [Planctomycetota bacterium]